MNKLIYSVLLILFITANLYAQNGSEKQFITIIPGEQYKAGWFHNFWFGKHWRDIWTTPIRVRVLNLSTFAGGLTPLKVGGGLQTKSLRFNGKDGNIYKFRSVSKDPTKVLESELQGSIIADVLQDQISSSNPFGALIVVPLLKSVNIMQAEPQLVILPTDESLGEFGEEFGGMLGMIEVHPNEGEDGNPGFDGADKIIGTYKLFHRLEKKRSEKVDTREYLKARLLDNYVGDWDRHTDQWRWARYNVNGKKIWRPIPRDRDQAFPKYDGVFPSLTEIFILQLNHFDYEIPKARNLTWSGRMLDRRYLSELTRAEWDSVTAFVQNRLTNEVIEYAVDRLPIEDRIIAGDELLSKLKSRRDRLFKFSDDYYNLINDVVDIFCSDKDDFIEVNRVNNDETEVSYYRRDRDNGGKKGDPLYHKIFDNKLTSEVRIFLMDGDDKAVVSGEVETSPLVRIIGGEGKDEFVDNSKVHGNLFSILPIPNAENATVFYDNGNKSVFITGPGTVVNTFDIPEPKDDIDKYEPHFKNRSHEIEINPVIDLSSDDGLTLGGGPTLLVYDFLTDPYEYWMTFTAAYSIKLKSAVLFYKLISKSWIKGAATNIEISYTQLHLVRYFGFGNETFFSEELEANGFNEVKQNLFYIKPSVDFHFFNYNTTTFGLSYNQFNTDIRNKILLNDFHNPGYGLGVFNIIELNSAFIIDSRDVIRNSKKGILADIHGSIYPAALDNEKFFSKCGFDIRGYFSGKSITDFTLALKTSGEWVWGSKYPFQFAAFRGGKNTLRGYARERFSGDAAISTQAELRLLFSKISLYLPGEIGIHFFGETGRVFVNGENSSKWHPGYGGGVWLSLINRSFNTSFTVALSPEDTAFYLRARMGL
ncbi:MAG: BamA/TamA family outer membrane protein [Ignavibacteria bacterium]|nr:BamA/TamA family outer membrane protein [Ignavibacteria bacterium]